TPQRPQRCASTNSATTALALVGVGLIPPLIGDVKQKMTGMEFFSDWLKLGQNILISDTCHAATIAPIPREA
ncbi:hypothetical protein, partial [uncultured Shimia sp.]|uniref:hypothetical protein n=1 Tax=uncultured Shimia sp. TaxID=573152 RepID=UPI0025DF2CA7